MKRSLSYIPEQSVYPALGFNSLEPSSQLNPAYSPLLKNIQIVKGIPIKRLGLSELVDPDATAPDPVSDAFDYTVIGLVEFEDLTGTKTLLAFTPSSQFYLDTSSDPPIWTDISANDSGSPPVNLWTATDKADCSFQYAICTGLDGSTYSKWIVVTNGSGDPPLYWDGNASTFVEYEPTLTGFTSFQSIAMFFNRVILANVELSAQNPQMVFFSDIQSLEIFDGTTSGEIVVSGVKGPFVRMVPLGDRLVLYSEDSIAMMSYVGGDAVFSIELVSDETRLVDQKTIVNLGPYHLFLSQENVVFFDGSRLVRTIGDKIFRKYRDELAVNRANEAFAFHDSAKQHVYFTVPTGETGHVTYLLEYNLYNIEDCRWTRYEYFSQPTAMGSFSRVSTLTFDSYWAQTTPADQAQFPADQGSIKEGFPVRVIAFEPTDPVVYLSDDTNSSDAGTAVESFIDTIDFTVPQEFLSVYGRWLEIQLEMSGSEATVYYSTDGGTNYVEASTLTLTGSWTVYTVPIDVNAQQLRVRLENTGTGGSMSYRWLRVFVRPGGPNA